MTAAVPDPRECRHIGKRGLDCDCDEPAVPDPRFRDQLAEELRRLDWTDRSYRERADALLPLIAAELARVQAAANQRAAEELRKLGCEALEATPGAQRVHIPVADLFDRAAALDAEAKP